MRKKQQTSDAGIMSMASLAWLARCFSSCSSRRRCLFAFRASSVASAAIAALTLRVFSGSGLPRFVDDMEVVDAALVGGDVLVTCSLRFSLGKPKTAHLNEFGQGLGQAFCCVRSGGLGRFFCLELFLQVRKKGTHLEFCHLLRHLLRLRLRHHRHLLCEKLVERRREPVEPRLEVCVEVGTCWYLGLLVGDLLLGLLIVHVHAVHPLKSEFEKQF